MQHSERSSDRVFGLVMAGFFGLVAAFPMLGGDPPRVWALAIALAFLFFACFFPAALATLNRLWMKFGELLALVVSPIAMGVVFFGVITPIGWMMKLLGKKILPLRFDPQAKTYWMPRTPPGPTPESMKLPF